MGIFEPIEKQIAKDGAILAITKQIYDYAHLESHEIQRLKGIICSIDYLTGLMKCNGCKMGVVDGVAIRGSAAVIISPETPTLRTYFRDRNITDIDIPHDARLLGEYCPKDKTITLYLYNIRYQGKDDWEKLFAAVYLHEMYHAHFATKEYIPFIEEPMAELGAINALRTMKGILHLFDDSICDYYKSVVKYNSIAAYNFGSYLYDELEKMEEESYKVGPFLDAYKRSCETLSKSQAEVQEYLSSFTKNHREAAFKQLCQMIGFE